MDKLLEIRDQIDNADRELVKYFERRMELCKDVAEYKFQTGKPVFDRKRELEKIEKLRNIASDEFYAHCVEELFEQIMSMSRKMQYSLLREEGVNNDIGFEMVEEIPKDDVEVIYQGMPGAYSQQATHKYFGNDVSCHYVKTFRDAMIELSNGKGDYAVLPFENSTAGIVTEVFDLMVEYDCYILDTFDIPIDHAVLGVKGATLEDINKVYSHKQALDQSEVYLDGKGWDRVSYLNTATSAKLVADTNDKSVAAIASEKAAEIYGLDILDRHVNSAYGNATKFIVVSRKKIARKDAKTICISFEMPHESGSLYTMLSHLIYNDINMTMIQSRPIKDRNWQYRFYIEFEGTAHQSGVVNALSGINAEAHNMKILGNY
jgi:chorismate mutase/prephenate dehydratase